MPRQTQGCAAVFNAETRRRGARRVFLKPCSGRLGKNNQNTLRSLRLCASALKRNRAWRGTGTPKKIILCRMADVSLHGAKPGKAPPGFGQTLRFSKPLRTPRTPRENQTKRPALRRTPQRRVRVCPPGRRFWKRPPPRSTRPAPATAPPPRRTPSSSPPPCAAPPRRSAASPAVPTPKASLTPFSAAFASENRADRTILSAT